MGKLAKFFSRFSVDKFPKESQGRRLNEVRSENNSKQTRKESPPSIPRGPPSEGAMRAADAALSRIAAKQVPSKTPIQRRVEAESARMKKQMEEAEALASRFSKSAVTCDTGGQLKKVTFSCPRLLDDSVRGTYAEVDTLIEQALLEESEYDPAGAYTLLIIRSIESSQYPTGVDANDTSIPSIQTFRDKRKQNFITIIRNLIENPEKENFRRLRMGNKSIADLLELKFAVNFFETCGFIQREQPTNSEADAPMERYLVFPAAPTEEQLYHLKSMLSLLESGELIAPRINRDTTILQASENEVRDLAKEELPAEFFLVSRDDLRRWNEELQRMEKEKVLLTKAMRDRLKSRDRRLYRYALIRVRLPHNNIMIQGTFMATETVNDVRFWVSSCLADQGLEYSLWAPPGQISSITAGSGSRPATARVLLDDCDPTASLMDLGLAPSAILTLGVKSVTAQAIAIRLLPELEHQIIPLQ
ncbi:ubxPUB domain containing protein [Echinococcus multilocularis]|uniref:UbxPUB domain containing protein n=1 Tax=Echinococcus multilocularis TaxID=6211 RepID=A0A087W1E0_ECHMU|nr:ubxPUB domain containing protein [Echinococcus multilocularis]